MTEPAGALVLRRALAAAVTGVPALPVIVDSVRSGGVTRVFAGAGVNAAAVLPDGRPGALVPQEIRAIGGGLMVVAAGEGPLALADGLTDGQVDPRATPAETGLLEGRNVLLGFRIAETPLQICDWVRHHADSHGATGFLVVDRAPDDDGPGFADALRAGLSDLPVTVLVVTCAVPLGKAGTGPESHPFLAPDAPGKDRMTPPVPDPWRAPLASGGSWPARGRS